MTAFIVRIESGLLRCLLWTLWFPVPALEFVTAFTLLGIGRCFFGIGRVFFTLLSMYFVGIAGFSDRKEKR
jgi:hypothetical protein